MTYSDRLRAIKTADVIIGLPDGVKTPPHWPAEVKESAKKSAWLIYYMIDRDDRSWWDAEAFSHVPDSVALPLSAVKSNAPEWWDADSAEHGVLTVNNQWYPRHSDGSPYRVPV